MSDNTSGSHEEPHDLTNPMEGPALSGRSRNHRKQPPVLPNVKLYWFLYITCLLVYAIFLNWGRAEWDTIMFSIGPLQFGLGPLISAIPLAHFFASLKRVSTDEVAGKYFYGVPLFRARAGLNFVPFGVMNLERYPGDIQEIFMPAKADNVFWGDEEEDLPPGKVRPIWVPTRPPTDVEKDPLDAQMVVGIVGYAFWRVTDIFTFHARVTSIEESTSQVRSIWVRVAGEDIVQYTASGAIANQQKINETLDDNIRDHTDDWGIQVTSAGLTQINVSHTLGAAMRNRAKAPFEAQERVIKAEAEARERELLGQADGNAEKHRTAGPLLGRAEGLAAMAKVIESPGGSEVLAAETMVSATQNANVVFAGAEAGLKDLMAGGRALQEAFKPREGGKDGKNP